jgi:hypothetical protein
MAARTRGRSVPISVGRTLVFELMRQSRNVPLVSLRREFSIPALVSARRESAPKVSWVALFAKAYALAAIRHVNLRHNWLTFPWARIYEHPVSECVVVVEREWAGEEIVLGGKLRAPENTVLGELDAHIQRFRNDPVQTISVFRQAIRLASWPSLLRRFFFWSSLNWFGYKRCKRFGTFAISSVGNFGCELLVPPMPLTAYLTFGPISPEGQVAVCVTFDHRVMDGRHAARALEDVEQILNTTLAMELRARELVSRDAKALRSEASRLSLSAAMEECQ